MIFKSFKSRTEYCPNKQEFRKWFILFDLIIYSEIAKKSLFALSRSKTKLCINKYHTILIFPIPASGPSSRHSRVLCLTPPVSENCSLFSVLSVPNLCSSLESRRASQTQTPSIIKKERDTPYYDLIFPNHNALWHRPGSQGYWQHIMPGPVSPCLRVSVYTLHSLHSPVTLWPPALAPAPGKVRTRPGSGSATLSLKHQVVVFSGIYTDTFDIVSRSPGRDCAALKDEIY